MAPVRPWRWTIGASVAGQLFFEGATRSGLLPNMPMGGLEVEVRDMFDSSRGSILGLDASAGTAPLTVPIGGEAIGTQVTEWTAGFSYMYAFLPGWIQPYVGARISVVGVNRNFTSPGIAAQSLLTMAPGILAGVNFELTRNLSVGLRARASYLLYENDQDLSLGYADAGLLLRWEL
jgi:opacity protein-like surface antigen